MQLKTKFILLIGLIVCLSYGLTFYRTASFQEQLVVEQATRQAKMLFHQIRLTRQWIADHNGLFLVKEPGVEANPFLDQGEIQDAQGNWLVKRNPAMVTRELSLYAAKEGMGQFNVTSLRRSIRITPRTTLSDALSRNSNRVGPKPLKLKRSPATTACATWRHCWWTSAVWPATAARAIRSATSVVA